MNYYFISLLSYLICIYCWDNITIVNYSELQQWYFLENERHNLEENTFAIQYKDDEDLLSKLNNQYSLQLIEKQQDINVNLDDEAIILQFISQQENYIDICYLQHQIIECILRINNTLYNEGIIINEIKSQIIIPSKSCYNAFLIQDNSLLIQCYHKSINQFQYYILNDQSEIIDQITMNLTNQCRFDSKFQYNKLIINSINCEIQIIFIIEIIYINNKLQFNKNFTKLHELDNYPNQSKLIDLKICDVDNILLSFTGLMSTFNFQNQLFIFRYYEQDQQWFPFLQGSCFPFLFRGFLSTSINMDKLSPILTTMMYAEPKIKSIQSFIHFCIFEYEDQAIVMQDYVYKQSIQNLKQIFKLNTLPFLITLNKNNQITFYQIVYLKRFIQYQNFPFIAIFLNSLHFYDNDRIIFYCSTYQYFIKYPLEIPIINSIEIPHHRIINNYIEIDTNILFQSIPFYLDLELNQNNNFHFEYQNDTIITHHINLQIKQILKVISFDINFVIIIYENLNNKIIANIKNDNNVQNIQIITKTQELQVEFQKIDIDHIIIMLINSESLMKFIIVDKKDLKFVNQIKPKNKIKDYKFDLNKIIFLFIDNTISVYQGGHYYDYYSTKKKEFRDFWIKNNQDIKYNDFRVPFLYINNEDCTIQIKSIIPYHNDILITVDGQIILSYVFVSQLRILLIVKKENQLQLLLYQYDVDQLFLLYQMPTYQFQIQQPINIKFYGKLFGIITIQNEQEYLFIYDVIQQGRYCLRQITKILPNFNSFELIDETGIFFQVITNKIVISYPILRINIKSFNTSDYAQIHTQIKFKVKSFIQSIPSRFIVFLHIFNNDNNLRYKYDVQQHQLLLNNQNEIQNLDTIYGSINNLQLSNLCQGSIKESIQVVSQILLHQCQHVNQKFCLISESILIYDFFGLNKTITLPDNKIFLNNFLISNHSILIIYDQQQLMTSFFDLSNNLQFDDNQISLLYQGLNQNPIDIQLISLNLINNFIIVQTYENCQIYLFFEDTYSLECQFLFENIKQIQFLYQVDSSYLFLILNANSEIKFITCMKNSIEIISNYEFKQDFRIVSFHLLNSKLFNEEIQFNVIFFCPSDKAYIFEFTFNLNSLMLVKQLNNKYIRYSNINFENFQMVNNTIYILKGNTQNQISSYYLYKINLSSSDELIDYFYKYEQNLEIQIYNETHCIQIKRDEEQTIIQLLKIDQYRLYLQNNCELILHNDVSILISTIILEDNLKDKQNIILCLIIINSLLIIIIINKNKKKKVDMNSTM